MQQATFCIVDEQQAAGRIQQQIAQRVEQKVADEIRDHQHALTVFLVDTHEARLAAAMGNIKPGAGRREIERVG